MVSLVDILRLGWADSCQGGLLSGNLSEEVELELELSSISVGIRRGLAVTGAESGAAWYSSSGLSGLGSVGSLSHQNVLCQEVILG